MEATVEEESAITTFHGLTFKAMTNWSPKPNWKIIFDNYVKDAAGAV